MKRLNLYQYLVIFLIVAACSVAGISTAHAAGLIQFPDFAAVQYSKISTIEMSPGEVKMVKVGFYNKGSYNWRRDAKNYVSVYTSNPKHRQSVFFNTAWLSYEQPAKLKDSLVGPNSLGYFEITLKAPSKLGTYKESFRLAAEDKAWIQNSDFQLTIQVSSIDIPVSVTNSEIPLPAVEPLVIPEPMALIEEPRIRIGLYTTEEPIEFKSEFEYVAIDTSGVELGKVSAGEKAVISYNEKKAAYTFSSGDQKITTQNPVRLVPILKEAIFTLTNYTNRPLKRVDVNYNQFRNAAEVRFASKTGYLWVINELPIEDYLKGVAEAGDGSPPEFLKALMTAVRSYAYFNIKNPSRHLAGNFTLDAEVDQVYRGYAREKQSLRASEAVEATRGTIVTYKGQSVSTPYFARSDGRTRSYKEVWGGAERPWLVSVKTPYDKGYTKWGHGVGMSARDAMYRAKAGTKWEDILKYYYTGVELEKVY